MKEDAKTIQAVERALKPYCGAYAPFAAHAAMSTMQVAEMRGTRSFWRYKFAHTPNIFRHVVGRKYFDGKYSPAIRNSWRVGNYPIVR